ncbi:hypothetical protein HZH68_000957 [Vespula germanica]|uniref:Uncharacterized protein n=1 Tax=Vespula germanica TaxID=30212 RepID=A0A834NUM7_VESGE|nr:hypothetical protein HZH68_000957 [Vespula germanica]
MSGQTLQAGGYFFPQTKIKLERSLPWQRKQRSKNGDRLFERDNAKQLSKLLQRATFLKKTTLKLVIM